MGNGVEARTMATPDPKRHTNEVREELGKRKNAKGFQVGPQHICAKQDSIVSSHLQDRDG